MALPTQLATAALYTPTRVCWASRDLDAVHYAPGRAFPRVKILGADERAPVSGPSNGDAAAALRAAFVHAGVLLADGAERLTPADRRALRAALSSDPETGIERFAALGLRWTTAALRDLGTLEPSGDALRRRMRVFAAPLPEAYAETASPKRGGATWIAIGEAFGAWSAGEVAVTPDLAAVLRALAGGHPPHSVADADALGWEVVPSLRMMPLRTPTLPPATHTNAFLVGSRDAVLVEPASPYPDEIERVVQWVAAAAERGVRPSAIVATHHHPDHIGGATALAERLGLPLWGHRLTAERLRGEVRFDRLLEDAETIELDGPEPLAFELVHTPGHAPGHLCLHERHSGAMIAGDMVAGVGTILVEPVDGDMTEYLASLRRMADREPSLLLPAHGGVIAGTDACLTHYREHRLMRERRVYDAFFALGRVAAVDDAVPLAYDDTPKAAWPLAKHALAAHLIKLEREGYVERVEGGWRVAPGSTRPPSSHPPPASPA